MAITVEQDDIIRIILRCAMPGNDLALNVFHYEFYSPSGTDVGSHTLENFAYGFWQAIGDALTAVTSDTYVYTQVDAILLDADFNQINGESWPIPTADGTGEATGDAMPKFVTYTFRYLRPSFAYRHGYKRFAGVVEDANDGGQLDSTSVASIETLRAALAGDISALYPDGTSIVDPADARPIIYRATLNGDPVSPVLYEPALGVVFNGIGSQNTRK